MRRRGKKRIALTIAGAIFGVSMAGGCVSNHPNADYGGAVSHWGKSARPGNVPGVCGPYGEGVPIAGPGGPGGPGGGPGPMMMAQMGGAPPMHLMSMQKSGGMPGPMGMPMPLIAPPGIAPFPGMPPMPHGAPGMVAPGMPPGMTPPGMAPPGLKSGVVPASANGPGPGGVARAGYEQASPMRYAAQRTQVRFVRPTGMRVSWFTTTSEGKPAYSNVPIETPGRYNFPQGAIYRLRISNIEGRPGLEVYPTMEVVPSNPKTEAFLAHSAVPIDFTPDDFKQIAEGNYVVKVIYLPDPQFQDVATTGTEEILSTRLEPGIDPIQEALRRGSILAIIRMGNVDQEAPNTPPLSAASPNQGPNGGHGGAPFGPMWPGQPGMMVPFGPIGPGGPVGGPGGPMIGAMPGGPSGAVAGPAMAGPVMGPGGRPIGPVPGIPTGMPHGMLPPGMVPPPGMMAPPNYVPPPGFAPKSGTSSMLKAPLISPGMVPTLSGFGAVGGPPGTAVATPPSGPGEGGPLPSFLTGTPKQ